MKSCILKIFLFVMTFIRWGSEFHALIVLTKKNLVELKKLKVGTIILKLRAELQKCSFSYM